MWKKRRLFEKVAITKEDIEISVIDTKDKIWYVDVKQISIGSNL